MQNPRYNQEPEDEYDNYAEYEDYPPQQVTSVGLPAGQLALIIGVNAVISLVISIGVVLLAGRSIQPEDLTTTSTEEINQSAGITQTTTLTNETRPEEISAQTEGGVVSGTPVEQVDYTVEAGDTLSSIAQKFLVPVADIMVVNGLTNEDFIQAGQVLVIPLSGVPTATPTFTPVPQPTDTPLPFDPPTPLPTDEEIPQEPAATVGPSPTPTNTPLPTPTSVPTSTPPPFEDLKVVVSEIIAPGDLQNETVVILNQGAGTSLKDWTLEGSTLGIFQFPDVFLFSGGSIRIHTAAGQNTASDLYLGQSEPAWAPGDTVLLLDNKNVEISQFTAPAR